MQCPRCPLRSPIPARVTGCQIDLVINLKAAKALGLKAAKALGLTIPPSLLARADQVIE